MGIDASYEIILKSQLGPKFGTLVLKRDKKRILAKFEFLGHENILEGHIYDGNLELKGKIITPLGLRECFVAGVLAGDEIQAQIIIETRNYQVTGKKRGEENEI